MRRTVGPSQLILDWIASHPDSARQDALLAWVQAVAIDADMVTSTDYVNTRTHRTFRVSHIPGARTCATFLVFDTPARAIHIIGFVDEAFDPDAVYGFSSPPDDWTR